MCKLFYLLNEFPEGNQTGYRNAINELVSEGILQTAYFYSFLSKKKEFGHWDTVLNDLKMKIRSYEPDIVLIAHLNRDTPINGGFINEINKSLNIPPKWIYDERDVYGYIRKPLAESILTFAASCDLVTLCTYGKMMERFKKAGAKRVIYLPQVFDANFGMEWEPTNKRKYDVIMIGNRSKSRIPFKSMPGIRERENLVNKFAATFGDKFAVFGLGWEGFPCSKGPIDFFDQEKLLHQSWLSIGWDHFYSYDGYYSDRLPIALVSGVPHLSYRTPGVDKLFQDKKHIFYFSNLSEAIELSKKLLNDKTSLIDFGKIARQYTLENFNEKTRFKTIIDNARLL